MPAVADANTRPRHAPLAELDPRTLYAILRLRTDVFVVEQTCPYPELDGRDLEPGARQFWIERGDDVAATLRVLSDPDGSARIGRVATAPSARGEGLAATLMRAALAWTDESRDVVLGAQAYLEDWYAGFGFVRDGAGYDEDGIAHVPMRRSARARDTAGPLAVPAGLDPEDLGMSPHPEGGWFRETWRHEASVATARGERPLMTAIAFLLRRGERSAWHRVASDELWLWQGGGAIRLTLGGDGPAPVAGESTELARGGQFLVPAGVWQCAEPAAGDAVLVACVVSPGFDYADFTLAG